MPDQSSESQDFRSSKIKFNEQITKLLASEKKLYDTQGKLDLEVSRMESLNKLALATIASQEVSEVLVAALSFLQTNFVINYGVGLLYEAGNSRLIANTIVSRGKPIKTTELDLTHSNLNIITSQQNVEIVVINGDDQSLNSPLISFAAQCLQIVFSKPIHFEKDARIMLLSNSFGKGELTTYLLCYCASRSAIGYRERTALEEDIPFLDLFCKHLDHIIGNVLYKEKLRKLAGELEVTVEQRTNELKRRLEFEDVITKIAQHLSQLQFEMVREGIVEALKMIGLFINADRTSVFLFAEDNKSMSIILQWCSEGVLSSVELFSNLLVSKLPNICQVLMSGNVCQISDVDLLPVDWNNDAQTMRLAGLKSFFGIPLVSQGRCVGFVSLVSRRAGQLWKEGDMSLFVAFGELIVAALERQRVGEQLERAAKYDILTGIPNRFQFEVVVDNDVARASRNNLVLALLSIDIDHFKSVNDTYGHNIGDLLLKEVSSRISSCIRREDFVARVGGDEFIALIIDLKFPSEARGVAQKIVTSLKQEYRLGGHLISSVSASIGIACFPTDGGDSATLIKKADIAMYQVKGRGGNGLQFLTDELQNRHQSHLDMENALIAIRE